MITFEIIMLIFKHYMYIYVKAFLSDTRRIVISWHCDLIYFILIMALTPQLLFCARILVIADNDNVDKGSKCAA